MKRLLIGVLVMIMLLGGSAFKNSPKVEEATMYSASVQYDGNYYPISLIIPDELAKKKESIAQVKNFQSFCYLMEIPCIKSQYQVDMKSATYQKMKGFISKKLSKNAIVGGIITLANMNDIGSPQVAITVLATSTDSELYFSTKNGKYDLMGRPWINTTPITQFSNHIRGEGLDKEFALELWVSGYTNYTAIAGATDVIRMSIDVEKSAFKLALK